MAERVLVTGVLGCIGAWTAALLLRDGAEVVGFDLGTNESRLELVLEPSERARLELVRGDIGDLGAVERVLDERAVTRVIHLAALQIPFCREDPPRGAYVNVVGTANVFEAVARRAQAIAAPLVLASSAAVYEPVGDDTASGPAPEDGGWRPATHYGVYKVANEGTARIYWQDNRVPSVALRPYTVYGPARDQGVTAAPTLAMQAALRGEAFHIPYGGRSHFQYAPDVARALIAALDTDPGAAVTANLAGGVVSMDDVVAAIEAVLPEAAGLITHGDDALPLPPVLATGIFERLVPGFAWTDIREGVRLTIEHFRARDSGSQ